MVFQTRRLRAAHGARRSLWRLAFAVSSVGWLTGVRPRSLVFGCAPVSERMRREAAKLVCSQDRSIFPFDSLARLGRPCPDAMRSNNNGKTLPGRLELPTLRLTASRSNQLSYGSHVGWLAVLSGRVRLRACAFCNRVKRAGAARALLAAAPRPKRSEGDYYPDPLSRPSRFDGLCLSAMACVFHTEGRWDLFGRRRAQSSRDQIADSEQRECKPAVSRASVRA